MARPQSFPILVQLRNAKTFDEHTRALQALKNEIVGHIQKKETWIGLGVLEPIVVCLSASQSQKQASNRDARLQLAPRSLSDEDNVRLQALQLIASFANGGPPFLQPLHAARALPALLTCISPTMNAPQIVTAALKALLDIADAAALAPPSSPINIQTVADALFSSSQHLESICLLLSSTKTKNQHQLQISLTSNIIRKLCFDERHQHALTTSGVLDMFATQLASFAVAEGHVVPGAEELAYSDGLFEVFPTADNLNLQIGPILDAIGVIIGDSKYRATRLINSPSILAVFPCIRFDHNNSVSASTTNTGRGRFLSKQPNVTAMEHLLPAIPPLSTSRGASYHSSINTPDLSGSRTPSRTSTSRYHSGTVWEMAQLQAMSHAADNSNDEVESPLIPWLIVQVRNSSGYDRLLAATVLTALFKAGLGRSGVRETSIGLLVVPVLLDLITKYDKDPEASSQQIDIEKNLILERTPAVLARLISNSEYLQKVAFECGAVKKFTRLLRHAYEPVSNHDQPKHWSPHPDTDMDVESTSEALRLGQPGQSAVLAHRLRLRESALKATGALASGKDDYRKALVEEDLVPYVVESLTESPGKPRLIKDRSKDKPLAIEPSPPSNSALTYGANPLAVIVAACYVIRMLTRSISILRTSLVDHGVALPVFQFMKHADVNVQIAATATICNLVVDVSPVRELLAENGVMQVLCEHAHSDNPALRLNALWALKHFVHAVSPDVKKACLEQLESGWLVQLICDDSRDGSLHGSRSRQSPGDDLDEDMDTPPSDEPSKWLFATNGSIKELDVSRSMRLQQAEDKLASIRDSELNPLRRARNDDLAIQEQSLDFIRNLISPGSSSPSDSLCDTTEMIDYILNSMGQDRFFEILASRLRPKVLHPFSRRTPSSGREARVLHPQTKIIAAVIFILVHIAGSVPRFRQLVIRQTELLKLLGQQASSKDKEVRVALCHLVLNLTDRDDGEMQECSERAAELKRLGFHTKMETLVHQDRDLDVRERAKTAVWQIHQAIELQQSAAGY